AKLSRLLARVNYNKTSEFRSEPYPPTQRESLDIILTNINGALTYESMLEAWMMKNIDKDIPVLKEIVGNVNELEYFGNNVLYGIGGEKVDVLLVHKRRVRYKATAIELKKGKVDDSSIEQISRYSYWVAQLTTANVEPHVEELVLQPVVIGNTIEPSLVRSARRIAVRELHIPYLTAPCRVQVMPPLLTRYYVRDERMNFEILT
ncbi:MAG: hypothetical protein NZ581_08060, partial [Candidatus Caldarchaeum sp.]|nr:hypothetical protein [Candidatus Caldarchaeum sp.]MDW8436127.1 hypothetical protein [Candidatus Caldarchaeum sp.]